MTTSVAALFNLSAAKITSADTPLAAGPIGGAATGVKTSTATPAAPGSSVDNWVSFFESLPAPAPETLRDQYLNYLTLPQPVITTDDDDIDS